MNQFSMRTIGLTLVVALALSAFALWSNPAEPTESEFRQVTDTDTLQHGYLNVRSAADLFPHGR